MANSATKKTQKSHQASRGDLPYLAEAERLQALLTDGAKPAGYHIRDGYWLRDAATKQLLRSSYTSEWRPAHDVLADGSHEERKLTSYHLSYHLRGKYSVAWTSPSWTSLMVLDIDRPHVPETADAEAHWQADAARDETLASVWDAFGCDEGKQPVVLATPGGGYHLYFPLCRTGEPGERERTWPAAWAREWFEWKLRQAGLTLRPGTLELYPSGVRLRAPCGRGTALLAPQNPNHSDDLRLEPVHARVTTVVDGKTGEARRSLRRRIGPMVTAFCDAIDDARRPLEAWMGNEERAWSPTWGPFGDRNSKKLGPLSKGLVKVSRDKEDVNNPGSRDGGERGEQSEPDPSGQLLYGDAFKARIRSLSENGLTETGGRHDAALKLAWHLGVVDGIDRENSLEQIRLWLEGYTHASATRDRGDRQFVEGTLREVAHYIDTRVCKVVRWRRRQAPRILGGRLEAADEGLVERCVRAEARDAAKAILGHLKAHASDEGVVLEPLEISSRLLEELCGDKRITVTNADGTKSRRRTSSLAIEELARLGMLAIDTNYSVGHHGRQYTCWYQFGSGVAPQEIENGGRELARREIEGGTLIVEIDEEGRAPRARLEPRDQGDTALGAGDDSERVESQTRAPWWQRMYERRVYVPGDFFGATAQSKLRLVSGPFRHRHVLRKGEAPAAKPRVPANSNEPEASTLNQRVLFEAPVTSVSSAPVATVEDCELRDAIARAWAAFEDSS